ncbi:GNAT family N-acetyltransferase [Paenibacillus septentrionalis]|uniref:GNAT family N-acetyltransferase n=1 Tax=Paenibacillus septentrionalis TaxID=429342 RepID=A0ABW1V4I7_9BACL
MLLMITDDNNNEWKNYVRNNMYEYNKKHFPKDLIGRYQEVHYFLKDDKEQVYGGILGEICWNWLEIHYLYIEQEFRKSGYGTKLLSEVEGIARQKQCDFIKTDTLSFQALDFYRKHGFEVYGLIDNAGGHTHYYLKKTLSNY